MKKSLFIISMILIAALIPAIISACVRSANVEAPTAVPAASGPAGDTAAPAETDDPSHNGTDSAPATDTGTGDVTGEASVTPGDSPLPTGESPDGTEYTSVTPDQTTETMTPGPGTGDATGTAAATPTPTPAPDNTKSPTEKPTATPTPGPKVDPNKLSEADQKKADQLLASVSNPIAPDVGNARLTAANEDGDVTVWFDHSYNNTPAETVTSTGLNTYQIKLARNEIEGCHFMVASKTNKTGVTLEVSDFVNGSGGILPHEVCYGWYFDGVEGKTVADPIPVLEHEFNLKANKSQMFIIKVKSTAGTAFGQYSANVTLKDSAGREIKKAKVYAYVWNFTLPVASTCKTLTDLNEWAVIVGANRDKPGTDGLEDDLYALYYDYMLENKMNCYTLPYAKRGWFWDPKVEKYLDDPRCTAYTLFWKFDANIWQDDSQYTSAQKVEALMNDCYNRVSKKQEWLDKAYFYPNQGDEPLSVNTLNLIKQYNAMYTRVFGAHKLIIPIHYNTLIGQQDYFKYLENDVNVWCPKTYFFNTAADKEYNSAIYTEFYPKSYEQKFGTFKDRMAAEQAGGDEVWWYVTRFPHNPEITFSINDESVKHRLLFWQQKLYKVDGLLYYMCNDWENPKVWTKKYEDSVLGTKVNTYGNGVLIYPGGALQEYIDKYGSDGYPGPIGSLRLESIRDGVEDYDYFTILDKLYGSGTSDLIIKQITTSLGVYSTDSELFTRLRTAVGDLIAKKS